MIRVSGCVLPGWLHSQAPLKGQAAGVRSPRSEHGESVADRGVRRQGKEFLLVRRLSVDGCRESVIGLEWCPLARRTGLGRVLALDLVLLGAVFGAGLFGFIQCGLLVHGDFLQMGLRVPKK